MLAGLFYALMRNAKQHDKKSRLVYAKPSI